MSEIPFPYKRDYLPTAGSIWRYEGQKVLVSHVCVMWRYESEGTYGAFKSASLSCFTGDRPTFTPFKDFGPGCLWRAESVRSAAAHDVPKRAEDLGQLAEIEDLKAQVTKLKAERDTARQVETRALRERDQARRQKLEGDQAIADRKTMETAMSDLRAQRTKLEFERDAARVQRDHARGNESKYSYDLYKMRQERDLYFKLKNQAVNELGKEQKRAERVSEESAKSIGREAALKAQQDDIVEKLSHMVQLRDSMASALREMEQRNRKLRIAMGNDADTSHLKAKNNQLLQQKRRWKKAALASQHENQLLRTNRLKASIRNLEYVGKPQMQSAPDPGPTKAYVDANRPTPYPPNWDTLREINALKAKLQRLTAHVSQMSDDIGFRR